MSDSRAITIFSGGQTGADRAALDFAIERGLTHGGWCPRGRRAEDGVIPPQFLLQETPSAHYSQRTEWNVRDSDATVVFSFGPQLLGGTRLTLQLAQRLGKPVLHLCADEATSASGIAADDSCDPYALAGEAAAKLQAFLAEHHVRTLNIAGPRASQEPEIASFVRSVLQRALAE